MKLTTPQHLKERYVSEARALFKEWYPDMNPVNRCVNLAHCMAVTLQRHGMVAAVQAGSACWHCGEQTAFDGNSFAYIFEDAVAAPKIARGELPELHAWCVVLQPPTYEVIDLSTCYAEEQMKTLLGGTWLPEAKLPDYIWKAPHEIDAREMFYRSNKLATAYVHHFALGMADVQLRVVPGFGAWKHKELAKDYQGAMREEWAGREA